MRCKFLSYVVFFSISLLFFFQCRQKQETLFELKSPAKTGIDFVNTITETDSFNILTYEYIYNGGGVAIADFNNDGLQDIFFTGNEVPNKLYLNHGNMRFEDVSLKSKINVAGRWNSGAVVVDINNDGWKDIYVCTTLRSDSADRANMLFLNKGVGKDNVPIFEEVANQYGIADTGYSMMASFFDYDRDGDLDLYLLTNQLTKVSPSDYRQKVTDGSHPNNDRLYRNNGDGTFTNVTKQAGIVFEGYGLGLAIGDFNNDDWPDIYVSNDYISNDLLYINNQDGTFSNKASEWISHSSQFSMGNDASDFNNDGHVDIVTVDMLPETNLRKKTTINNKSYVNYINNEKYGYEYQYTRNMLHLNNGIDDGIAFSEIGQLSGVYQTEWSWSPLLADFDNDGFKDLLVTNGFPKDITDKDFANFRVETAPYLKIKDLVDSIPVVKIPNYAFKNKGDLTFVDVSKEWGFSQPSFSNGAAFVDLDNDGDLDYVVNNINDVAFVYENRLYTDNVKSKNHYLKIKLSGPIENKQAIGSKIRIYHNGGSQQYFEHYISRGYLSSVEDGTHVGLGQASVVDSVKITWPDGSEQTIKAIEADKVLKIEYDSSLRRENDQKKENEQKLFHNLTYDELNIYYKHDEEDRIDFNIQRTLPHKFTQSGPGITVGDVNNDRREDFIVGGSMDHLTTVFIQQADGTFIKSEIPASDKHEEDLGLLLFDADGDMDLDLYVVSGSIENEPGSKYYQDRLYRNDGKGKFELDTAALPRIRSSGSCVRAADFDGDNDLDLFVGGRVVPGSYPYPAESYLLRNDNGKFVNVTGQICPDVVAAGMITDALFTDFDNDGSLDLLVVGEFMPITFYRNENGSFKKVINSGLESNYGWWNSIVSGDFDNDGDIDYVAGNLGLNNGYQVNKMSPLNAFAKDFDKNGSIDLVLACYVKESLENPDKKNLYPIHFWDEINAQSPRFRQQFSKYKQYGKATIEDLFTDEDIKDALVLRADYFETSYIENLGNGKFRMEPLPLLTQIAPVNGMVVDDYDNDGNQDILMIGNDYGNEVFVGRYDAFRGLLLLGDGKGKFEVAPSLKSGFLVEGDAKALAKLHRVNNETLYIATQNKNTLRIFSKNSPVVKEKVMDVGAMDSRAELIYGDGRRHLIEFYYGSGYLSQSSRKLHIPSQVREIIIYDSKGNQRIISIKDEI